MVTLNDDVLNIVFGVRLLDSSRNGDVEQRVWCRTDLSFFCVLFLYHLRAHNQHVDYSGAYSWGVRCSSGPASLIRNGDYNYNHYNYN